MNSSAKGVCATFPTVFGNQVSACTYDGVNGHGFERLLKRLSGVGRFYETETVCVCVYVCGVGIAILVGTLLGKAWCWTLPCPFVGTFFRSLLGKRTV